MQTPDKSVSWQKQNTWPDAPLIWEPSKAKSNTLGPDVLADIYPDLALLGYYLKKGVKVLVFQCSALQNELL